MKQRADAGLATVLRLKTEEERVAAASLRAAQARHDVEVAHLETAQRYLDDYRLSATTLSATTPQSNSRLLRDGHRFLLQLEQALVTQRQAVENEQRNVEFARAHWVAARVQREAIEKLIGRRSEQTEREQRWLEQRQSDEHAMQAAARARVVNQG